MFLNSLKEAQKIVDVLDRGIDMNKKISEEIKALVIARLDVMSSTTKVSIGPYGVFSKDDLKRHVMEDDEIGKKIVEVQMAFLRSIKEGKLYLHG